MSIRTFAFAVALVLGIGLQHHPARSPRTDHTGAMWTERSASSGSRHDAMPAQQAPAQGTGSQDTTAAARHEGGPERDRKLRRAGGHRVRLGRHGGLGRLRGVEPAGSRPNGADRGQAAPARAPPGWLVRHGPSDTAGTGGPEGATHSDTAGSEASGSAGTPGRATSPGTRTTRPSPGRSRSSRSGPSRSSPSRARRRRSRSSRRPSSR